MLKSRILHQPRRARYDPVARFRSWAGYRLSPDARLVIAHVEHQRMRGLPDPKWQPLLITGRCPEKPRGLNFRMALILDGDRYPRRRYNFSRLLSAVTPVISDSPDTLLIIHGTYRPRTRTEHFSSRVRHARTDPEGGPWPMLDLAEPPLEPDEDTDAVTLHIPSTARRPYLRMSLKRYFGIKFALL